MITWTDGIADWDGSLPAVLIGTGKTAEQRRHLLHALVAKSSGLDPDTVVIEQPKGQPPVIRMPISSGLHLSLGSRGLYTAAAIAASPVGVDVELIDEKGEIPWRVLHASEAEMLGSLPQDARAAACARLWSLKEAYLKALGLGLSREPSSFCVRFADKDRAAIYDPSEPVRVIEAQTTWRRTSEVCAAVSAILLERSHV
jgi:phosphopantetheinyl transferase